MKTWTEHAQEWLNAKHDKGRVRDNPEFVIRDGIRYCRELEAHIAILRDQIKELGQR